MVTVYNHTISIEKGTSGTSSVSSPTLSYSWWMDTKASIYQRSQSVRYNENEELVYTTEFRIRYNDSTKTIDNKFRILYDNKYYRIIEIQETEYERELNIITQHFYDD